MKYYTKFLKNEREMDLKRLRVNNSKARKNPPADTIKAVNDKADFLINKWNNFLYDAETVAQINKCNDMLNRINRWRERVTSFYSRGIKNDNNL